ncbi:MAG: transcriptional regulator [Cyanobacteria bacterium J06650_10]
MTKFLVSDAKGFEESYGQLLQRVEPRKITTEQEYKKFLSLLEDLLGRDETETLSEQESLLTDLLVVLVQDYEREHTSLPDASPLDVLHYLMEANDLKQSNLVGVIGSSGIVSEVINGKREISKSQARSLGELFNISYKLFL